jgi:hypothetical protein
METLTLIGIAVAFLGLWVVIRFIRYQRDPRQYQLAELLGQEAANEKLLHVDKSSGIALYVMGRAGR